VTPPSLQTLHLKSLSVAGFVQGVLNSDDSVDVTSIRRLVELALPLPVTFHRAYDRAPLLSQALVAVILPEDLPEEIRCSAPMSRSVVTKPTLPRETGVHAHKPLSPESEHLIAALETHHWCRTKTAKALGLNRSTLWRKMRELHFA
jgi:hypothetical protein